MMICFWNTTNTTFTAICLWNSTNTFSQWSVSEVPQILATFRTICVWITTNTYPLPVWSVAKLPQILTNSMTIYLPNSANTYHFHNNPSLKYHKYVPLSRQSVSGRIRCIWQNRGSFSDCCRSCTYTERRRLFWTLWLDVPDRLLPGGYTGAD